MDDKIIKFASDEEILINNGLDKDTRHKRKELRNLIFKEIMSIVNEKGKYMLGPEKRKVADFISNHYNDIHDRLTKIKDKVNKGGK